MPDGSERSLRSFAAVADEAEGRPSRLIGSVQDVTELAEAIRRSEESLTLMETLQSTAPVGFAFVDRDFRIVRINQTLAEVNGAPLEDQLGRTVAEVVPDVWSQMESVYRGVLDTGEPVVNLEVDRERGETGDRRHWLASYYPVIIDEEVIGVGVVVVDITDRKEAEYFRSAVMDTMVEGLYTLDGEGRLTFMNSAASKILGWTEEELRGKDMHAAIHFQNADGSPHPHEDCALLTGQDRGAARPHGPRRLHTQGRHDLSRRLFVRAAVGRDDGPRCRCRVSRHERGAGRGRPGQARAGHARVGRSDQGRTR